MKIRSSGRSSRNKTVVRPGERPRTVLARAVEGDPDTMLLRKGHESLGEKTDVFEVVEDGEVLYAATDPVVGVDGGYER